MPSPGQEQSRSERLLKRFARQWIAGENTDQAVSRAKESNKKGIKGIINLLGEQATDSVMTERIVNEYLEILRAIYQEKVLSCISVKPTQIGLSIDQSICRENFVKLLDEAKELGIFVWIDMESSQYTQATLDLYRHLRGRYDNVGVAIQAYLKRSEGDLRDLLAINGKVRLCKGAYKERSDLTIGGGSRMRETFSRLMKTLFEKGDNFAIATHDDMLIEKAKVLSKEHKRHFEFQMLLGVRESLKSELVGEGFNVVDYIPYGRRWLAYTVRRFRERKRNILLIFRSLFGG